MTHFVMISRHTAESCPMNNEKTRQIAMEAMVALPDAAKKFGIKVIGSWSITPEHLVIQVFDAVNLDSVLKFSMEPSLLKWWSFNTTEIKAATTLEETIKLIH
ncbi:MAG: hypothetical protein ABSB97_04930 [Thermoplasmata archaeon]|jgi:hypothetical protein